jgi:hypothetical protein
VTRNIWHLPLLCLALSLGNCGSKPKTQAPTISPTPAAAGQPLTSNQKNVQFTLPKGWLNQLTEEDSLNLKISNTSKDAYLTLQTRRKQDLPQINLEQFARIGRKAGIPTMTDVKITGPTAVTTVNGYPAIQYKFQGRVAGINTVLLHTAVESPKHLHQILAGASGFGFERHQKTLQALIQTFEEVSATASKP